MGTYLEPGTFNFVTPAQDEPITTHRKKKSQPRRGDGHLVRIASPAKPPIGDSRPILNVPAELLVEIIGCGSQKDKLAWMLVSQKFVDPAERALWRVCGRKGVFKLLSMNEEKRGRLVKMISQLNAGDDPSFLRFGLWRHRSFDVQHGVYPDHIPMLPASWFIHSRLKSFTALSGNWSNDAIDDVFPALKKTSGLEVLQINHHIDRNTSSAFPRLLKHLPRLRAFEARYVSSGNLLHHLAGMLAIEDVALGGALDCEMVHRALEVPSAFNRLEAFDVTMFLNAAVDLLPQLRQLKKLRILLVENQFPSWQGCIDATTAGLRAISTLSSLTLLRLQFVCRDLPSELQPLKHLSSLRKLKIDFLPVGGSLPEEHFPEVIETLRSLPLENLETNLVFHNAEALNSLGRACPQLRFLYCQRLHELDGLDTSSPPVFPKLEILQIANLHVEEDFEISKKCIKTWANKVALAAPALLHFQIFGVLMAHFRRFSGVRRWYGHTFDQKEEKWTLVVDFDSHKGRSRKNRKRG
ncbi:hypothetical protein KCU74_g2029, partial [Aureobasidium melanogenum]